MVEITEENFPKLIGSELPLVIDFWAEWCGPCKALAPMLEEFAREYDGRVIIGKCDVEENNDIAVKYMIRNVPTILFFKGGEVVHRQVGAVAKTELEEKLRAIV